LEERTTLFSDKGHQGPKAALLHEVVRLLQTFEIGLGHSCRHGALPDRSPQIVRAIELNQTLASFHGTAQKAAHARLGSGLRSPSLGSSLLFLRGELIKHRFDWLCPTGQELSCVQCRRGLLAECASLD